MSELPFSALLGGKAAGEAADTPEVEGFGDEEDAAKRYRCTRSSESLRGMCTHGAKGDDQRKEGYEVKIELD